MPEYASPGVSGVASGVGVADGTGTAGHGSTVVVGAGSVDVVVVLGGGAATFLAPGPQPAATRAMATTAVTAHRRRRPRAGSPSGPHPSPGPVASTGVTRLVLWDVDGTLIHTRGIGADVFDRAFRHVLGRTPEGRISLSGKTDPQIVREYLELMAVHDTERHLPQVLAQLEAELSAAAGVLAEIGEPLPGIPEVLARLAASDGVRQSLLTGNVVANAVVKVTAFGLERWLDLEIGAYGSDHADRRQLVPIALERARRLRGVDTSPADTWVVGDTGNDLACARAGGARCLLVATGGPPFDELKALDPDALLADLADTDLVVRILTAD